MLVMRIIVYCGICMGTATSAFSQSLGTSGITRNISVAASAVAGNYLLVQDDPLSVFENPAALTSVKNPAIAFGRRQFYSLREFDLTAGSAVGTVGRLSAGVRASHFGERDLFEQLNLEGAMALKLATWLSLGAGWLHTREEYGGEPSDRWSGSTITMGALLTPLNQVLIAGAVAGIELEPIYESIDSETIQRCLAIAYHPTVDASFGVLWEKRGDTPQEFSIGQSLNLDDRFIFLSGLQFDPTRYSVGAVALINQMSVTYSYVSHPDLDGTHGLSLTLFLSQEHK